MRIEDFKWSNLHSMSPTVKAHYPFLWNLLAALLNANEANVSLRVTEPPSVRDDIDNPSFAYSDLFE